MLDVGNNFFMVTAFKNVSHTALMGSVHILVYHTVIFIAHHMRIFMSTFMSTYLYTGTFTPWNELDSTTKCL